MGLYELPPMSLSFVKSIYRSSLLDTRGVGISNESGNRVNTIKASQESKQEVDGEQKGDKNSVST